MSKGVIQLNELLKETLSVLNHKNDKKKMIKEIVTFKG